MERFLTSYGASVRGPLHQKEGTPNEDAWLRANGVFGSLVVVCDGLGSKTYARHGARSACKAVLEAIVIWTRVHEAPIIYLAHLIEVFWRLQIHPCQPKDAATTCLIAWMRQNGECVFGGIGDGLLAVRTGDDPIFCLFGERRDDFSSQTYALGSSRGLKAWRFHHLPPTPFERMMVLATDGVSDDLVPEKIDGFCKWVVDSFQNIDPAARWRRLATELRSWPTPKHLDDKTLAVLKISAELSKGEA